MPTATLPAGSHTMTNCIEKRVDDHLIDAQIYLEGCVTLDSPEVRDQMRVIEIDEQIAALHLERAELMRREMHRDTEQENVLHQKALEAVRRAALLHQKPRTAQPGSVRF